MSMRETLLEAAVSVAILVFLLATRVAAEGGFRLVRLMPPCTGDLMRPARPRWQAARLFLVLLVRCCCSSGLFSLPSPFLFCCFFSVVADL